MREVDMERVIAVAFALMSRQRRGGGVSGTRSTVNHAWVGLPGLGLRLVAGTGLGLYFAALL